MKTGGLGYGLFLTACTCLLVLLVFWLVEPEAMPTGLRDHVCVERR